MFIRRDFIPFGHVFSYPSVLGVYHLSYYPIYWLRGSVRWLSEAAPCPCLSSVALKLEVGLAAFTASSVSWSSGCRPRSSPCATCSSCSFWHAPSSLSRPPTFGPSGSPSVPLVRSERLSFLSRFSRRRSGSVPPNSNPFLRCSIAVPPWLYLRVWGVYNNSES